MPNASSVASLLQWGTERLQATSPTERLDAELLLGHVLQWSRVRLLVDARETVDEVLVERFRGLIARREALEPVAYLLGYREFYGLEMLVTPDVLVPRPETELLVELALERAKGRDSIRACDIGTGTGCIAIAFAMNAPQAVVTAVDVSPAALAVARQNVERYSLADRVRLVQGDLLGPIEEPVDLLLSNPPYTILAEVDEGVRLYEPHLALDGGVQGLDLYGRLLSEATTRLRPGASILLEIGAWQGAALRDLASQYFPGAQVSVHQDLAGLDRIVVIDTAK
jgi:release factor glutamine methyltransferase